MASIKDALETDTKIQNPLISLTFLWWHLFRKYNTKTKVGLLSFLERCVPHAERDVHFVCDDGFAL